MDWKTLIKELQSIGLSQAFIADAVGKSQAWVSAVLKGEYDDLKWSDGQALIALHSEKVGTSKAA